MIPAMRNDCPVTDPLLALPERNANRGRANSSRPNSASTMLGTPAIISIADSTTRASHRGRAYSTSHTAMPTPQGSAIAMPIAVRMNVPISGSLKPPECRSWSAPVAGDSTNRLGRSAEIPLTSMNSTIPTAITHSPIPTAQHSQ
jgi:hypothetical protein